MGTAATILRDARSAAGLSQRELGRMARVPQASISRIEQGDIAPRSTTLERLLAACGWSLSAHPAESPGVDRSLIRDRLALTPLERSRRGTDEALAMLRLGRARLRRRPADD